MTYREEQHLAIALEPIHVGVYLPNGVNGAKGTIARNQSDSLPTLPASSLKGCARANSHVELAILGCDGKGRVCPQPHRCASCAAYGYANLNDSTGSLVRFSSGEIVMSPWSYDHGTLWTTTLDRLSQASLLAASPTSMTQDLELGQVLLSDGFDSRHVIPALTTQLGWDRPLNISPIPILSSDGFRNLPDIPRRLAILSEQSFARLACSSVSVATSIALSSHAGTANPGALYSMEAITKNTVFCFSVLYSDPSSRGTDSFLSDRQNNATEVPATIEGLQRIVWAGLKRFAVFGIGGRRSRGFGRLRVLESHAAHAEGFRQQSHMPIAESKRVCVFISYSRKDVSFARRLDRRTTESGTTFLA